MDNPCQGEHSSTNSGSRLGPAHQWLLLAIAGLHLAMLWWSVHVHGPVYDEVGHLTAGLEHWLQGDFAPYRQDPPLVRLVSTAPIVAFANRGDIEAIMRAEGVSGLPHASFHAAPALGRAWLRTARKVCTLFSLLALLGCYVSGKSLGGTIAGLLAAAAWACSPLVLGNGVLFLEDVPCAALAIWSALLMEKWSQHPTVGWALATGLAIGCALSVKFTALLVTACLLMTWALRACLQRRLPTGHELLQLAAIGCTALLVVNAVYAFQDTFLPLKAYGFTSGSLVGEASKEGERGNRFANSPLGSVPVPVPAQYLIGLDFQQHEFERRYWCYLAGEWKHGGWWYYYLYALAVKEPIGTLLFLGFGTILGLSAIWRVPRLLWPLVPGVALFAVISSYTGINRHPRYILPAIPFLLVFAAVGLARYRATRWMGCILCVLACLATLRIAPHFHAHFNLIAGGPERGPEHLLFSAIDYGQDLLVLRRWLDKHPQIVLEGATALPNITRPSWHGLPDRPPPMARDLMRPGWYALTVMSLHDRFGRWDHFRQLKPHRVFGWTVFLYRVTPEDVQELRRSPKRRHPEQRALSR